MINMRWYSLKNQYRCCLLHFVKNRNTFPVLADYPHHCNRSSFSSSVIWLIISQSVVRSCTKAHYKAIGLSRQGSMDWIEAADFAPQRRRKVISTTWNVGGSCNGGGSSHSPKVLLVIDPPHSLLLHSCYHFQRKFKECSSFLWWDFQKIFLLINSEICQNTFWLHFALLTFVHKILIHFRIVHS